MIRNILIIIFAIFLSFILFGIENFIILKTSPLGNILEEYSKINNLSPEQVEQEEEINMEQITEIMKRHESPFDFMVKDLLYMEIIFNPLIAIFVGAFIGFFGRNKIWLISLVSFLPFIFVFLFATLWSLKEIALSIAYILLVGITAHFIFNWRNRKKQTKV